MENFQRAYYRSILTYIILFDLLFYFIVIRGTADDVPIARLGFGSMILFLVVLWVIYIASFFVVAVPFFFLVTKGLKRFKVRSFFIVFAPIMGLLIGCAQALVFGLFLGYGERYQILIFLGPGLVFGVIFAPIHYWFKRQEGPSEANIQKTFE